MTDASAHPSEEKLQAFGTGRMPPAELESVADHVSRCDHCCRVLQSLRDDTLVELARGSQSPSAATVEFKGGNQMPTGKLNQFKTQETPPELRDHPRYRILRLIGAGGMGTVYQAEHLRMERVVALKVINPNYTANPQAVLRFHREVKAAARLTHENIVTAYDADQAGQLHFFVMEYVEGQSLDKILAQRRQLPIDEACGYAAQVAAGLQHAFEKGMVHRDIKPHNLMITQQGTVKILDFGLARLAGDGDDHTKTDQHGLTSEDVVLGTPDYLAPEQARNSRNVDIRADLYSLGCSLYQFVAGQTPFPTGSTMQKLLHHNEKEPQAIEKLRPDVPLALAKVVGKMMAKRPEDRYQTPADVVQALAPFHGQKMTTARPPAAANHIPRRGLLIGAGILALLAVMGIGGLLVLSAFLSPAPARTPKVLYVLPQKGLWYADYKPARDQLERKGIKVMVASSGKNDCLLTQVEGNAGKPVPVDVVLDGSVRADDFDAIIFAGYEVREFTGQSPAARNVNQLIHDMSKDERRWVAAMCVGQIILGNHGVLKKRRVAASPEIKKKKDLMPQEFSYQIGEAVPLPVGQRVVVDGQIITAGGPEDAEAFANLLAEKLRSPK